jgi:hypothetical protein
VGAVLAATSASQSDDPCTLSGSNLDGTGGRDVMCGTSGADSMNGRGGADELRGEGGADTLVGSSGDDLLSGLGGNDRLTGGTGADRVSAGSGNDVILNRDGDGDVFTAFLVPAWHCGTGTDSADLDLVDAAAAVAHFGVSLLVLGCEDVTVGAVREGPNVAISRRSLAVRGDGRTAVRLKCPSRLRQPSRCAGTLRLQLATRSSLRRRAPRTRYSLRRGLARSIPLRLSRRDRRTFQQRRRATGSITSVEQGQHGKKTTIRSVALRARR